MSLKEEKGHAVHSAAGQKGVRRKPGVGRGDSEGPLPGGCHRWQTGTKKAEGEMAEGGDAGAVGLKELSVGEEGTQSERPWPHDRNEHPRELRCQAPAKSLDPRN